jgi:hypothetical protein
VRRIVERWKCQNPGGDHEDRNCPVGFSKWESRVWDRKKWESGGGLIKADASLKSFLFTLKKSHNGRARRFALKAEKKNEAIHCDSDRGPCFCDIGASGNCNANTDNFAWCFGDCDTNDTGVDGTTFFTGSKDFQLKKIEVFEISD